VLEAVDSFFEARLSANGSGVIEEEAEPHGAFPEEALACGD
jgi:hypothetical protein